MLPIRLSFVTYNLWQTHRWPERAPALRRFLELFAADVICVQELTPPVQKFVDETIGTHDRVHDSFPGWTNEGSIYWDRRILDEVDHGAESVA